MLLLERIKLVLESECAEIPDAGRRVFRIIEHWLKNDPELNEALELHEAVKAIDNYEHTVDADSLLLFHGAADHLNEEEYDNKPGTLASLLIRAGEIARE